MIAQAVILALVAVPAWLVGRYGMTHSAELTEMISDPDIHDRREGTIRRGSVAAVVVALLLAGAAVASLVAGILQ